MKKVFIYLGVTDKKSLMDFAVQFVKFGLVGLSNTAISLALYYIFLWIDPGLYIWGNAVGFVISVANAFFWSRRYVFMDSRAGLWTPLLKSYLAYGGSFLLSVGLLYLQVEWLGISKVTAPILNLIVTVPLNFVVNKFWTFR